MTSIVSLHFAGETDGATIPDNDDTFGTGDGFDTGTHSFTTNSSVYVDDGDLFGLPNYHDFTARNRVAVFDGGASNGTNSRKHDFTATSIFSELVPICFNNVAPATNWAFWQARSAGTVAAQIRMMTTGTLQVRAKFTAVATGSTVLQANTWYWLAVKVKGNATTGYIEAKLYSENMVLLETIGDQTENKNTQGTIDRRQWGLNESFATNGQMAIGEIFTDDADYPNLPSPSGGGTVTVSDIKMVGTTKSGTAGYTLAETDPDNWLGKYFATTEYAGGSGGLFDILLTTENTSPYTKDYRAIGYINLHATATASSCYVEVVSSSPGAPDIELWADDTGPVDKDNATAQGDEVANENTEPEEGDGGSPVWASSVGPFNLAADQGQMIWVRRSPVGGVGQTAQYTLRFRFTP